MAVRTHPRNSSRGSICWHCVRAISPAENLSWNRVRTGSSVYYWVFTWVTPSSYCTANHLAARKCSNNKTRRKKVGFGSAFTTHSDSDWSSHFLVPFRLLLGELEHLGGLSLLWDGLSSTSARQSVGWGEWMGHPIPMKFKGVHEHEEVLAKDVFIRGLFRCESYYE